MSIADFARLGRLHPLILHFPIGLLFGALVLEVLAARRTVTRGALGKYLLFAALSAVLTAATGWVLSHEDGYGGATLERHERLGIAVGVATVLAALLHDSRGLSSLRLGLYRAALVAACVLLVPAGHLGSLLSHGEDWLDGPRAKPREAAAVHVSVAGTAADSTPVGAGAEEPGPSHAGASGSPAADAYTAEIAPLLGQYCATCHGAKKRKGHLRLDSPAGIRAGGESGPVLVAGDPEASPMLVRPKLPLEHEDHMPPEGKPQPSEAGIAALEAWIRSGAPFGAAPDEPAEAPGESPSTSAPPEEPAPVPAPDPAPPADRLAALDAAFVHHERVEPGREELRIEVSAVAPVFGDAELRALVVPLAAWVSDLVLARSAVTDAGVKELARFPHLRRLDLRATPITDAGLAALGGQTALEELVLAQTKLGDAAVDVLLALPHLKKLALWNAGLSSDALARLRARPGLVLNAGDEPPAEPLASESALAFTSDRALPGADLVPEALRPINTTCPVSGDPVNPKYALVHTSEKGTRVIGFCCPNCPKEFWSDPAKFEPKLP